MTEEREVTLIASLEDGSPDTKTEMVVTNEGLSNAKYEVFWLPGDKITVFSNGASSVFTSRNTEKTKTAEFIGTGTFVISGGVEGEEANNYIWSIYPARSDLVYSVPEGMTSANATIQTTLPSIQKAKAGGFADDLAIMIGQAKESLSMPFKNAYSGLWVKIGGDNITSMTLRGNNNQDIAGKFTLGLDSSRMPEVKSVDVPSQEITLIPESGCFEAGKYYYFITLPGIPLPNGYTVTLHRTDGMEGTFSITGNRTFARNVFLGVSGSIDQRVTNWHAAETQGTNEIWYTTTDGNPITPGAEIADMVSANTYDGGKGVLRFNSVLTSIPNNAFAYQTELASVILPEMVTSIGAGAFFECTSLTEVTMGERVQYINSYAFECCAFTSIDLPSSLVGIGSFAFAFNPYLESITIPESVRALGYPYQFNENPFTGCRALKRFDGKYASEDHLSLIYSSSTYGTDQILVSFALGGVDGGSYTIPDGVTTVAPYACAMMPVSEVDFNDVTSLFEYAFEGSEFTSITIPAALTSIGAYAFRACEEVTSIRIEQTGTSLKSGSIGIFEDTGNGPIFVPSAWLEIFKTANHWSDYADRYEACIQDNQISYTATRKVDYTVYSAGYDDFSDLNEVVSNEYDESTHRGVITFRNTLTYLDDGAFTNCQDLTGVQLPETVRWIGQQAFYGCSSLSDVSLSKDLYSIGKLAFANCSSLEGIILPEGLTHIFDSAFMSCGLKSITLPQSLIGLGVRSNSSNLIVHIDPTNPFYGCAELKAFYGKYATADHLYLVREYEDDIYLVSGAVAGIGTTAYLPEVTYIANWSLCGGSFQFIEIPETVTTFGIGCFEGCSNLRLAIIPERASTLSLYCFSYCPSLKYVQLMGKTLPSIYGDTFGDSSSSDSYPIRICSEALSDTRLSDSSDPGWYTYRSRIGVYQSADEIWYNAGDNQAGYSATPASGSVLGASGNALEFLSSALLPSEFLANSNPAVTFPVWGPSATPEIVILKYSENICKLGPDAYGGDNWYRDVDYTSLPTSINSIGARAFQGMDGMKKFPAPRIAGLREIGEDAFNYCISMEGNIDLSGVTSIGSNAFKGCSSITSVNYGPTYVPYRAFYDCSNLQDVILPDPSSLETIGNEAFTGCVQLVSVAGQGNTGVDCPNIVRVNSSAFQNTGIRRVSMGTTGAEMTMGENVFNNCPSLTTVNLPNLAEVPRMTFFGCHALQSVNLMIALESIADYAFANCTSLQSISLRNVKTLGAHSFENCTSLERLVLPKIVSIGERAFSYTRNMTELRLGPELASFGDCVFFDDDTNLRSKHKLNIYFYGDPYGATGAWGGAFNYTDPENTSPGGCFKFAAVYVPEGYEDGDEWWFHDLDQLTYSYYDANSYYLPAGDNISDHI